jgi:hypothetical protein
MQRRTLDLRMTQNGNPAPGLSFYGTRLTGWGGCDDDHLLGKSGSSGEIHIAEFYSEMWTQLFFKDEAGNEFDQMYFTDDENLIRYSNDPKDWPKSGIVRVDVKR